ncbi:MAG: hypothetical protein JST81_13000 [Bacteroidetes bacterium]|nr:hypothetical protein [Bacteroidota bacterium]
MNDQGKYFRLFATLFFSFIGFIVFFILLLLGIKLFFGLLSYIPWFTYVYMLFLLMVPPAIFVTAYIVFFKRTTTHPSKPVRLFSYLLFSAVLLTWCAFLAIDMVSFFRHFYHEIGNYYVYNFYFLAGNMALLFFIGVIQALTTEKEKDWMEKAKGAN